MDNISALIEKQREYFNSGATRSVDFRKEQLSQLARAVENNEDKVFDALKADLSKSQYESYLTEIGILLDDIKYVIKHIDQWAKSKKVRTPLMHSPASSWIHPEPLGVSLIIAPWNYPFLLALSPLVGSIAAGNCAIIKPSEFSKHTSRLLADIVRNEFDEEYLAVVEGASEASQALLKEKFDIIFFTGSVQVGKIVMTAAAQHLTPIILELGGKSPSIVDSETDVSLSAKRVASGKFINAGQTCIAPDYVLVQKDIKDEFVAEFGKQLKLFYGENPQDHTDYPRIINDKHFNRLVELLNRGRILHGGQVDLADRYIAPTLLDGVTWEDPVMQEEIFGPILPLIEYEDISQVITWINSRPKPLALYLFTTNEKVQKKVLEEISYGGGCINDTLIHLATPYLPFGGVGNSGMGNYHGKASFDAFSHYKSVMKKTFLLDNPFRYPPFEGKLKWVRKFLK